MTNMPTSDSSGRVLACGCVWSPQKPQRCGLCDRCNNHCECDKNGYRDHVSKLITTALRNNRKRMASNAK